MANNSVFPLPGRYGRGQWAVGNLMLNIIDENKIWKIHQLGSYALAHFLIIAAFAHCLNYFASGGISQHLGKKGLAGARWWRFNYIYRHRTAYHAADKARQIQRNSICHFRLAYKGEIAQYFCDRFFCALNITFRGANRNIRYLNLAIKIKVALCWSRISGSKMKLAFFWKNRSVDNSRKPWQWIIRTGQHVLNNVRRRQTNFEIIAFENPKVGATGQHIPQFILVQPVNYHLTFLSFHKPDDVVSVCKKVRLAIWCY